MKTVVIVVSLIAFFVMGYVTSVKGLDLRRWSSWLYGVISFLCGFALIMSLNGDLMDGLKAGAIFALLILVNGATTRWHKQKYEGMVRPLLLQYGKEDDQSLFAKLVRRLLGKYKH